MNAEAVKFTGVSEQGRSGLLWTIFDGEPFAGRRVASFGDHGEALEYLNFKNDRKRHRTGTQENDFQI